MRRPFFVIPGANDPMVAADHAKEFAQKLRATSTNPVLYAELPGGQHNFDRFPSIRFFAVVDAVEAFASWVRTGVFAAAHRSAEGAATSQ